MADDKSCPFCGRQHGAPFSKEVIELFQKIRQTVDEDDRADLMVQLARQFTDDVTETDETVDENIHDMISDILESLHRLDQSAMRLARVLVRSIPEYLSATESEKAAAISKSN